MAVVPYLLDKWCEGTHRLLVDATLGKERHHFRRRTINILRFIAFRIKHGITRVPSFRKILAISIARNRLIGEVGHHLADDFPLVSSRLVEAAKVLTYQRNHITASCPVTPEISLRRLLLRVLDDELVLMTRGVRQNHFNVSSHTSRAVETIAQIIGNIIYAYLCFQVFVVYTLFHNCLQV